MRNRFISQPSSAAVMAFALIWLAAVPGTAQTAKTAAKSGIARMPDGHPDLRGTYDLSTMTTLERLPGDPPVLTKERAEEIQKAELARRNADGGKLDPNRPSLPVGGDTSPATSYYDLVERAAGGAVGGFDRLWFNEGTSYTVVDGQIRTSIVIDPPDGRVPPFNAAGQKRNPRRGRGSIAESPGEYDNPEQRPIAERCLLRNAGPPAIPDLFYNDLHQIVQTPDAIMILTEMMHDARTVRMNAQHLDKKFRFWMGDSVGRWEGDTLVIDTTNFTDKTRFRGSTENLHVVERLTRSDDKTLLYRFTVDDPETWDRPWTGEMTWAVTNLPIFEYACHEGNYALGDVMRGARVQEAQDGAKIQK
jgi:hypothetical protein